MENNSKTKLITTLSLLFILIFTICNICIFYRNYTLINKYEASITTKIDSVEQSVEDISTYLNDKENILIKKGKIVKTVYTEPNTQNAIYRLNLDEPLLVWTDSTGRSPQFYDQINVYSRREWINLDDYADKYVEIVGLIKWISESREIEVLAIRVIS